MVISNFQRKPYKYEITKSANFLKVNQILLYAYLLHLKKATKLLDASHLVAFSELVSVTYVTHKGAL